MTPEKCAEIWKEICFILSKSVRQNMIEKDFEGLVVRAIETLGWKEYKNEIKRQQQIIIGRGSKLIPDLVVYDDSDEPLIAIEVKRPGEDLTTDDILRQLKSYMRQLQTDYGLVIGETIRFFYDGPLYPHQKEPVLLGEFEFDGDPTEGQEFVSNINKDSLEKTPTQYLNNLIIKVKKRRDITKLKKDLESKETKEHILASLKSKFSGDYGSEIVEGALKSMVIQIRRKEPGKPPENEPNEKPKGTTLEKVLYVIQTSEAGISRKEICNKLSISSKQTSNAIQRLNKQRKIESYRRGVWIAANRIDPESPIGSINSDAEKNLLNSSSENIKEAYFKIKDIIYKLDSGLTMKITKTMLCYRDKKKGLIWINPKKNNIQILLRKGKYKDKCMKIKYEGTFGGYPLLVLKKNDIDYDYLKDIFQQAYDN